MERRLKIMTEAKTVIVVSAVVNALINYAFSFISLF